MSAGLALLACGGNTKKDPHASLGGQPSIASGGANGGTLASGGASPAAGSGGWTLPHAVIPWQSSKSPLCAGDDELSRDVWSDARGVFALIKRRLGGTSAIYQNAGDHWQLLAEPLGGAGGLHGVPGDSLLLYGSADCSLLRVDGKDSTCLSYLPYISDVRSPAADRIFALSRNRVLHYEADYLTIYGEPLPEPKDNWPQFRLWVGPTSVIVAADEGKVYVLGDATTAPSLLTIPDGFPARSLWANSEQDVWVGAEQGRLAHYDGATWTLLHVPVCESVTALWGTPEALFIGGDGYLGRLHGDVLETLVSGSCQEIPSEEGSWERFGVTGLWGNSANEVFISVDERTYVQHRNAQDALETSLIFPDECGPSRLYWFNGTALSPL